MKITKKQLDRLVESIVAEMCEDEHEDELNESELSPDPEWESMTSPAMRQHYPGSFEQDGQRSDLQEQEDARPWKPAVRKAAIHMARAAEGLEELIGLANELNPKQRQAVKTILEKTRHLTHLVNTMKNW